MPVNGFTVGRDVSVDIITSSGPLRFGLITGFSSRQEAVDIKVKGMDGLIRNLYLPDGWQGSFDYERTNGALVKYFCKQENDYFTGVDLQVASITETIREPDGTISQTRFEGVVMKLDDAGDVKGDATVKQKVTWMASRRKSVA